MALFVATLSPQAPPGLRGAATWGSWAALPWDDPSVLATEPDVVAPETSHLLVLTPPSGTRKAYVAAGLVAAVRTDLAVHVETVPASTAVTVRALETVPADADSPNHVAASVAAAVRSCVWGAWTPSVAKLERPSPSLGQHVQSWIARGAGFLAVHGTSSESPGWVGRLPQNQVEASRRLPRGGAYEAQMFGSLPEEAIGALFAMGLQSRPVRRDPAGDAESVWGHPKAVEFVLTPTPTPGASRVAMLGAPTGTCAVCREPVWGDHCPFCRAVTSHRPSDQQTTGGRA